MAADVNAPKDVVHQVYRYSYPAVFLFTITAIGVYFLLRVFDAWKQGLRDEIYLIGEQLHNHGEMRTSTAVPPDASVPSPQNGAVETTPIDEVEDAVQRAEGIPLGEQALHNEH